ncbi:2OG-Fe dioxygenase family protein [Virgisporangium ochraceum]|uniref:Uncharacterized protein n=1 Tax=Virgisporangium ochraceum TaxID=65505 RepID=A0A8J3ZXF1_9ACTN|nr:2OG-Fe dioxygenase family protein [Virgisporangium ochraceum]GIJ70953.1 hypothetical protein Voc01_058700 [Virgisporangium ochraceum]
MTTTEVLPRVSARPLSAVWESLAKNDFALVTDARLGLPAELRPYMARRFFSDGVLEADHPGVHKDRERARDVVRYHWSGDRLTLREHDETEIRNRSGFMGTRTVNRVTLLTYPLMDLWIRTVLSAVPPYLRQERGTFGINFFRTRTTVVAGPHQDDEEFVVIYVVDKVGGGAESTLHRFNDPDEVVFRRTLEPGDLLIFRDQAFLHSASPLVAAGTTGARRDAVVCTVDYHDTYPLA